MSTSQKIISCSSLVRILKIMFRKLLRIEILLEMGTPQISQFLFFLSVVNQDFQFDWEIPNTKKYFRKEEYQNVFWENIFWTFKQKLIILLHTCIKCYIRKHFFKKRKSYNFFLTTTIWTSHCVPRIVPPKILRHQFEKVKARKNTYHISKLRWHYLYIQSANIQDYYFRRYTA